MSQSLFTAITDLPVIVQGALGSALFALVLWLGQKAFRTTMARITKFNRARRIDYLADEIATLHCLKGDDLSKRGVFVSLLVYRSLRNTARAFLWLTMGLIASAVVPVFGIVGYLGALYYFFAMLNTLRGTSGKEDVEARLEELYKERRALTGEA